MKNNGTVKSLNKTTWNINNNSHSGNAVYFFGFIGAITYYFQHSDTFWMFVLGLLKAIVWPAMLVHQLLGSLN